MGAIVMHDAAESVVGDMPWCAKNRFAELTDALTDAEIKVEDDNGWGIVLASAEYRRLKFLDRLEAYRFAALHAPQIMGGGGWPEAAEWLDMQADMFGVEISQWVDPYDQPMPAPRDHIGEAGE